MGAVASNVRRQRAKVATKVLKILFVRANSIRAPGTGFSFKTCLFTIAYTTDLSIDLARPHGRPRAHRPDDAVAMLRKTLPR
jgi:hypothetical protein